MNRRGFLGYLSGLAAFLTCGKIPPADTIPTEFIQQAFVRFNPPGSYVVTTRINSDFLTEIITEGTTLRNKHCCFPTPMIKQDFVRVSAWFEENIYDKTLAYKTVDREIPRGASRRDPVARRAT